MAEVQVSVVKWAWANWAVPLALALVSFYFGWHILLRAGSVLFVIVGIIQHFNEVFRLREYMEKIADLEAVSSH
jgi:hypothetical protein